MTREPVTEASRLLAEHRYVWARKRCECGETCGFVHHPAHVADVLAKAGLLVSKTEMLMREFW